MSSCTNDDECGGECGACIGVNSPNPGKCLTTCGRPCRQDAHCGESGCGYCANGECAAHPMRGCGEQCATAADCNGGVGLCSACFGGRCGSACGGVCKNDSNCIGGDGCTTCGVTGRCVGNSVKCLAACGSGIGDCSGECSTCFADAGGGGSKCGVDCGGPCTADSQCLGAGACGYCTSGICGGSGPAPPPQQAGWQCDSAKLQCVKSTEPGYVTDDICKSVCGTKPSGGSPGGIVGKWSGVRINKGYARDQWAWTFSDTDVSVFRGNTSSFAATVQVWGPGLHFTVVSPALIAGMNFSALFALGETSTPSGDVSVMTLALSSSGGAMPINFQAPMTDSQSHGEYVLFRIS
eukprot:TRINITY_DN252_c0_g1_i1.p2 TRINITY_DN252_c0_g1~~TRINITY_DN252_c0_g1_i1.p2  ORF type:complete len:351 (+),score=80.10 TRINITY_DN252_c0_g1_i1:618-1670(+)